MVMEKICFAKKTRNIIELSPICALVLFHSREFVGVDHIKQESDIWNLYRNNI